MSTVGKKNCQANKLKIEWLVQSVTEILKTAALKSKILKADQSPNCAKKQKLEHFASKKCWFNDEIIVNEIFNSLLYQIINIIRISHLFSH